MDRKHATLVSFFIAACDMAMAMAMAMDIDIDNAKYVDYFNSPPSSPLYSTT